MSPQKGNGSDVPLCLKSTTPRSRAHEMLSTKCRQASYSFRVSLVRKNLLFLEASEKSVDVIEHRRNGMAVPTSLETCHIGSFPRGFEFLA